MQLQPFVRKQQLFVPTANLYHFVVSKRFRFAVWLHGTAAASLRRFYDKSTAEWSLTISSFFCRRMRDCPIENYFGPVELRASRVLLIDRASDAVREPWLQLRDSP